MSRYIFAGLCILFLAFSASIYRGAFVQGSSQQAGRAGDGRLVWQKYNCQSCHQLYGLGGYLGPDLSNVHSARSAEFIKAIIRTGTSQMPPFELSESEEAQLLVFLSSVGSTGSADPRNFIIHPTGMISRK
jgi:nitric oxide reductase subunit C